MRLLSLFLLITLLAACGQKGALYLPSEAPAKHRHRLMSPADLPAATASSAAALAYSGQPTAGSSPDAVAGSGEPATTATTSTPAPSASTGTP